MLDFGLCVSPFTYKMRNVRFGIDFFSVPDFDVPKIPSELLNYKNFSFNKDKKRVSFTLKDGLVQRCTLSSKLVTTDPDAEKFLKTFLEFNPSLRGKITYYVFDEDGLDIPLFPGPTDVSKITEKTLMPVVPILIGVSVLYFLFRNR